MSFNRRIEVDGGVHEYEGYFEGSDEQLIAHFRAIQAAPVELSRESAIALLAAIDAGRISWSDAEGCGMLPTGTTEPALRAACSQAIPGHPFPDDTDPEEPDLP